MKIKTLSKGGGSLASILERAYGTGKRVDYIGRITTKMVFDRI